MYDFVRGQGNALGPGAHAMHSKANSFIFIQRTLIGAIFVYPFIHSYINARFVHDHFHLTFGQTLHHCSVHCLCNAYGVCQSSSKCDFVRLRFTFRIHYDFSGVVYWLFIHYQDFHIITQQFLFNVSHKRRN